jgi:hypothetical protein
MPNADQISLPEVNFGTIRMTWRYVEKSVYCFSIFLTRNFIGFGYAGNISKGNKRGILTLWPCIRLPRSEVKIRRFPMIRAFNCPSFLNVGRFSFISGAASEVGYQSIKDLQNRFPYLFVETGGMEHDQRVCLTVALRTVIGFGQPVPLCCREIGIV